MCFHYVLGLIFIYYTFFNLSFPNSYPIECLLLQYGHPNHKLPQINVLLLRIKSNFYLLLILQLIVPK